jgi:zinc protease
MRRLLALVAIGAVAAAAEAGAQQTRWPQEGPPRPLPARDVRFPPYHVKTLANGLQVIAVLHHEQPVVSMRMIVKAGGALDPKGKHGLADLTASLLTQGTEDKTANELNEEVDFIGAVMGAGAGTDLSFVNMVVMKDSFDRGLQILSDVARRPAFAPAEIDRQRQQLLSSLQVSFEDPEFIANAVFRRLVYGFHPYGMPQNGTPESIASLTRDDLLAFHRRNFVPNNSILAIVGDVTEQEAFAAAEKVFGAWQRRDVPVEKFVDPPEPTRRVVIVNKPDAVQTEVRVGQIGVRRDHADYMALNLAIRILGGEGANRLHQVLRTERGLTYGASADMDTLRETGAFEASTNTRTEATGEALRLMVDEFWRLQRERVGERELSDAKAYLTGSFPLTIETPDAIATQVLNVIFYGLPVEQLQSFRQRVNAVTTDDVERVARYYLRPDRLSIVLVGNAAAFSSQLKGLGFGNFETIEMSNLDLAAGDLKRARQGQIGRAGRVGQLASRWAYAGDAAVIAAQTQASAVTADAGPAAKQLLDLAIKGKGGLAALRGIRSVTVVADADMTMPEGVVAGQTITYLEYPNRVRVETKLPKLSLVQVYDGKNGWVKDPAGVHDVQPPAVREMEAGLQRDTIAILLAAVDGTVRARALPDVKDAEGRRQRVLELSSPGLDPMVMYLDPDTGLIAKQAYIVGGPGRPLVEELFSNYRVVDGVQIAFGASVRRGGAAVLERRIKDIRINAPLDQALFKRPS